MPFDVSVTVRVYSTVVSEAGDQPIGWEITRATILNRQGHLETGLLIDERS